MKKVLPILFAVVAILVALVFLYRWDRENNHGFQIGYYGDFNRVSNALASIPDVLVTEAWANCDVTLEEFGFTATMGGQSVRIAIGERDRIRELSGESLVQALKREIETQTKSSAN
jgi:hypothetical protein